MARLPTVGGDDNAWGKVLNDFLKQEHNPDGSLKSVIRPTDSRLTDSRTPTAHKDSHKTGGSDALSSADIGAAAASDLGGSQVLSRSYHPDKTGATDATTALQNFLAAIPYKGKGALDGGTYLCSNLTINKMLSLQGDGSGTVILQAIPGTRGAVLTVAPTGNNPGTLTGGFRIELGYATGPVNVRAAAVAGALGAATYAYRVTAMTATGETSPSSEILIALGAPGGVKLDWDNNIPGVHDTARIDVTSWSIYGRTAGGELLLANVPFATLTWTDDGSLTPTGAMPGTITGLLTNHLQGDLDEVIIDGGNVGVDTLNGAAGVWRKVKCYDQTDRQIRVQGDTGMPWMDDVVASIGNVTCDCQVEVNRTVATDIGGMYWDRVRTNRSGNGHSYAGIRCKSTVAKALIFATWNEVVADNVDLGYAVDLDNVSQVDVAACFFSVVGATFQTVRIAGGERSRFSSGTYIPSVNFVAGLDAAGPNLPSFNDCRMENGATNPVFQIDTAHPPTALWIGSDCTFSSPTVLSNDLGKLAQAHVGLGNYSMPTSFLLDNGIGQAGYIRLWNPRINVQVYFTVDGSGNVNFLDNAFTNQILQLGGNGSLIARQSLQTGKATPIYSTSITPNALSGNWQTITVTNSTAFAINAPTNPPGTTHTSDLTIEISNTSGGAMGTITWNAIFALVGGAFTNPANGKKRWIRFAWNGTTWVEAARAGADY